VGVFDIPTFLLQIDLAFGHLPIPDDDHLVLDNSGYHLECNQVKEKFRGRHWRSLLLKDLEFEADSLAFFTPEAFRFFLPAYIRVSLLNYEEADIIPMSVLGSLTRPQDPALSEYFKSRLGVLDNAQRGCLKNFIFFLRQCHAGDFLPGELDNAQACLDSLFVADAPN
jgi:hypothetical protein